ncbi:MAG: glycosyltransferase [Ramlibacter sp.]|nr:glycosyltransferase [Ramlibacter sp.]
MTAAELEFRMQPFFEPRWLESWIVRRMRSRLIHGHASPTGQHPRRLFVDVSVICRNDAATGIQRIVRAVATDLLRNPPAGWQTIAVGATRKRPYRKVPWQDGSVPGDFLSGRAGDVFLGLDFSLDDIHRHRRQLTEFARCGGRMWFFMYDLLPIQRPEWFSSKLVVRFRRWLRSIAGLATGFFCISASVEAALLSTLVQRYGVNDVQTAVVPMGWDLGEARSDRGQHTGVDAVLQAARSHPTALMVGTIEPRKGHADVLSAFDRLWNQGSAARLVIVGRPGWKNDALEARIMSHPRKDTHLFWLRDASDEALEKVYAACHGVIAASHSEGYGLPVIEALGRNKPVLARDIDVFRAHHHRGVSFFPSASGPDALAAAIDRWIVMPTSPWTEPTATFGTWKDTVQSVVCELSRD